MAKKMIEKGSYKEAYIHLMDCEEDYKDVSNLRKDFLVVYEKSAFYNENGNKISESKYEYDEKGNRIKEVRYDADGNKTSEYKCKYNKDGILSDEIYNDYESDYGYTFKYDDYKIFYRPDLDK